MSFEGQPCYYCGLPATSDDHVVPRSVIQTYESIGDADLLAALKRHRTLLVPACHECNCLAGATIQETLAERKAYIHKRLRNRHQRLLKTPPWSEEEIAELGEDMQQYIRASVETLRVLRERLRW